MTAPPAPAGAELRLLRAVAGAALAEDRDRLPADRPGVLVDLGWDTDHTEFAPVGAPLLTVRGVRGRLVLGPLVLPGEPGCPGCLDLRVRAIDRPERAVRGARLLPLAPRSGPFPWPGTALGTLAAVLEAELAALAAGTTPLSRGAAYVLDAGGAGGDWHPVLAHALCRSAHCTAARVPIPPPLPELDRPLPALGVGQTRRFGVQVFAERLEREYLDPWSGLATAPALAGNAALPAVQADVPTAWGFAEIAIGRAEDYATARTGAVLEGLERYAGWHCGGRDPVRTAAFEELERAVDPRSLGLHLPQAYATPGFEYAPFTPQTPTGWARAHAVRTGQEVLLPFHVAYYGATQRPDTGPAFVYENSNGCALGAGVEEALLAALLEVAERDAFLCAWYSETPLPELDLAAPADPRLAAALRMLRHHTRRELRAFRAVGEFGVPVVVLLATSEDPAEPATLCTAGCALTVRAALLGAVQEMAAAAPAISVTYRERDRRELERAYEEPDRVRVMADHALVAALPRARERFAFLLGSDAAPQPVEAPVAGLLTPRGDVAADLAAMLAAAERAGREVLVVDHTTIELHRLGLRCVKAVVPGTAPMTFGHLHRRLPSAPTVRAFRLRNGGTAEEPTREVRHEPHPFP
ncbi:TOMM precursor leader peptide-binding protein [Streptomyces tateyamensis]|uniref:Cyclodehydratase n=1 Tax=Streptomyces tateyamensis TaxID=565073 RepID=A0A345FAE4_9ACTN|nr:TOMM precursor leader peptide-binding protein [Streptomyces tateyamensis]AXG25748.1 cyclodehydratase [Streptomyces tateyamensis]